MIPVTLVSKTFNRCLSPILDCLKYDDFENCVQCKSNKPVLTSTDPDSCPLTAKYLTNG